jgi:hypothetical protein
MSVGFVISLFVYLCLCTMLNNKEIKVVLSCDHNKYRYAMPSGWVIFLLFLSRSHFAVLLEHDIIYVVYDKRPA